MSRFPFLLLSLFFSIQILVAAPRAIPIDPRLKLLREQVIEDVMAGGASADEVKTLMASMKTDGSWPDINYADKTRGGWLVAEHLQRLQKMAVIFRRPGGGLTGNQALQQKIISGIDYWLTNDFICPNWWYPQIGVPKILAPVMLLMEDKLSASQIEKGVKILDRAKIGMTGQNKVWLSGNVIYRSLLTNNVDSVQAAVKAIQNEIVVSEGEGIQPDYSFHQHGPQQQFGNYGSAYAGDMLKWAEIFRNTPFQFDEARIVILRNYLLEGMRWIVWQGKMDISACGRQLFPNAQTGKAKSVSGILEAMPLVDPAAAVQYRSAFDKFTGNRHFWKSDMTVHRRDKFYASVKMCSRRVGGAESCNEENVQGYHLGDGATYFYLSNEEYTDIFPFWNWKMIPGTTTAYDEKPLPVLSCAGYTIQSEFVGGVTDGMNGIATMAYTRDQVEAQKSWFFFEDVVICLGAGIHSASADVRTTINQSYLKTPVIAQQQGRSQTIAEGEHQLDGLQWLIQDNWGYYFPEPVSAQLTNRVQGGSWHDVLRRMPPDEQQAKIFTLWLKNGHATADDHYAYYVFPSATPTNIGKRASAIDVVSNTDALQVVEHSALQLCGLVFVKAGTAATKLLGTISANQPCIVMAARKVKAIELSVCDPNHSRQELVLTVDGNKRSSGAKALYDASTGKTVLIVTLPQGPEAGKTVKIIIE